MFRTWLKKSKHLTSIKNNKMKTIESLKEGKFKTIEKQQLRMVVGGAAPDECTGGGTSTTQY